MCSYYTLDLHEDCFFFDLGERSRYVDLSGLLCILFAEHHSWRFFNSLLHFAFRLVIN